MYHIEEKIQHTLGIVQEGIVKDTIQVQNLRYSMCHYKTANYPPENLHFTPYNWEQLDFPKESHAWFCFSVDVPKADENTQYFLKLNPMERGWDGTNPQSIVYIDGTTASGAFDQNHCEIPITEGHHDINLYFYTGLYPWKTYIVLTVIAKNLAVNKAYYDIKVLYEALKLMDKNSNFYADAITTLDKACRLLDLNKLKTPQFDDCARASSKYLENEYYSKHCGKNANGTLSLIGHTHIDVAWQWTIKQTVEKAQRSFCTAINLIEQYPEYIFMSSQPQLYEFVKHSDPQLYKKIKQQIKKGRWEAEGAMWLEPDVNLSSGESLIRQIMYGKRFMKEEFGVDNHILWLPDVFGYSAILPQIMKKCGVDTFFSAKLSWNDTTKYPHDNFIWQGIDGSRVFAVLSDTYSKDLTPAFAYDSMDKHTDKQFSSTHICTFGFADGGGGTTVAMMENYERLKKGIPGLPNLKISTVNETLKEIKAQFDKACEEKCYTPKWVGELYFELHRGTYTTMAHNKKCNRRCELLYGATEAACAMSELLCNQAYPTQRLYENWHTILKNQFHDILPGSSIEEVYKVSTEEYKKLLCDGEEMFKNAFDALECNINSDGGYLVYNPTSFTRSEYVSCDGKVFFAKDIPPHGYAVVTPQNNVQSVKAGGKMLENRLLKVTFDHNFNIVSVYDKECLRELVEDGKTVNTLELYEDYPYDFDAWEISDYTLQKKEILTDVKSVETVSNQGYAGFKITRKFGLSLLTQEIRLNENSKRIDFVTNVNWQETHTLLKTAFPLNIHTDTASYDIGFGYIKRPTHANTPFDEARFEVPAHKWADMSEADYGVSLLNNCKYGYSARDNVMSLTLLRSPTYPNPNADKGLHEFTYSLYPHKEGLVYSDVFYEAQRLNSPMPVKKISANKNGFLPCSFSFVSVDKSGVFADTIKKAEDGDGYIVRLYDAVGRRGNVTLTFGKQIKKAYLCDMLENNECECEFLGNRLTLPLSSFEIKTIRVVF